MNLNYVWKLGKLHAKLEAARTALDAIASCGTQIISLDEMKEVRQAREVIYSALDRVADKMQIAEEEFSDLMKIAKQPA